MYVELNRQVREDLSFEKIGTLVQLGLRGICPICGHEIDFCQVDRGTFHKCSFLPSGLDRMWKKVFSDNEMLVVGPRYLVYPFVERILAKYPGVRVWVSVLPYS